MNLSIAGLPQDFDQADLKKMFQSYGTVIDVRLIEDRITGQQRVWFYHCLINLKLRKLLRCLRTLNKR